jgi:Periplasmic copper-binding protein (NosD)
MTRITARRLPFGWPGLFSLLVLLAAGPALAVECGDTITGRARLDRDLICATTPAALTVRGGSLDLNGFTVVCDQTDQTTQEMVGVVLDGAGARLRDGAVTGCFVAIQIGGSGGHTVRDVTASASNQGVLVTSSGNRLLDSNIVRGRDDAAVQVDGSNNLLSSNDVSGSSDQGFEINGNANRVVNNRIAAVAEGIQLIGAGNHVLRNQIIGTTVRGVEVRAGGHVIKDNLIADGADDGIALLVAANGNEIRGNTIYGHVQSGLFVGLGTSNNTLERNQVLLNGVDLTDANPGCDANVWQDNVFETAQSDIDCID